MSKNTNLSFLTDYITADITNGRIGINNASPTYAFDVNGTMRTSGATYLATASGSVGIGTTTTEGVLTIKGTSAQPPTSGTTANSLLQLVGSLNNELNIGSNTVAGSYGSYIQASDNNLAVPYPLNLQPNGGSVGIGNGTGTVGTLNVTGRIALTSSLFFSSNLTSEDRWEINVETPANDLYFSRSGVGERMRITSGGNALIGTTTDDGYKLVLKTNSTGDTDGLIYMKNSANTASVYMFCATNTFMNTSDATMWMKRNGTTSRSINASGTINASGADYAEYMVKETTDDIAKGDIVGVNSNGKLTNIFADSVSFVIKSTDPSYVGGDTWFNIEPPLEKDFKSKNEFEIAYEEFKVKREEARNKVDRIAFSGQIPCNVLGANVGDYIIPINNNGKIKGQAISNPTFEQYQNSIAKVWKIMEDGRAWVAVKIG